MSKPYVTVYKKKDGSPHFAYACSVPEWLATGEYTLEAPGAAKKPPELINNHLPSAGREANRDNPIVTGMPSELENLVDGTNRDSLPSAPTTVEVQPPTRPAPRRRGNVGPAEVVYQGDDGN